MKETTKQNVYGSGNIQEEMNEIKKMQLKSDSLLTLWSEGCAGYYSLFCC